MQRVRRRLVLMRRHCASSEAMHITLLTRQLVVVLFMQLEADMMYLSIHIHANRTSLVNGIECNRIRKRIERLYISDHEHLTSLIISAVMVRDINHALRYLHGIKPVNSVIESYQSITYIDDNRLEVQRSKGRQPCMNHWRYTMLRTWSTRTEVVYDVSWWVGTVCTYVSFQDDRIVSIFFVSRRHTCVNSLCVKTTYLCKHFFRFKTTDLRTYFSFRNYRIDTHNVNQWTC
jgi:hypothetical protein